MTTTDSAKNDDFTRSSPSKLTIGLAKHNSASVIV